MGDSQIAKAEEFEKKAEKKLNGWGLFSSKYEDAAECFDKSANFYKLAKSCIFLSFFPYDLICLITTSPFVILPFIYFILLLFVVS